MSIFGEPLPHEDDTATSLIRREGFPPFSTYDQMPVHYACYCCSEINPARGRNHLLRTAKQERELEREKLMQLNIIEERAKNVYPSIPRPRASNLQRGVEDEELNQPAIPLPPRTLDELRKARRQTNTTRLIVTVHHGRSINVDPRDPVSVLVRCGAFEGQTARVPRGRSAICTWEELFEFPYPNEEEGLEVLVVDDTLPAEEDHVFGGIVVPPHALRNRARGDEETLPVCAPNEMHRSYGRMKETPMGSIVVSWYVKREGEDGVDATDLKQNLEGGPINCNFVVHRLFQYTDNGAVPYEGGVLCLLRDTDDNCSESGLYAFNSEGAMSSSPYYGKNGCTYLPQDRSQMLQLITPKKLGHVLICVAKDDVENEEDEELIVVGAVPLDFERLYHRGSAVLLVESKVKEDVLWGEIALEWGIISYATIQKSNEEDRQGTQISNDRQGQRSGSGPRESLFLTVVCGLNLTDREGEPLAQAQVSVFACDMEGSTYATQAVVEPDGVSHVITWNQEVRFIEMDGGQSFIDVQVLDDKRIVSNGRFELLNDSDALTVRMHDPQNEAIDRGEILVSYKLIRSSDEDDTGSNRRARNVNEEDGDSPGVGPSKDRECNEGDGYGSSEISKKQSEVRSDTSPKRNEVDSEDVNEPHEKSAEEVKPSRQKSLSNQRGKKRPSKSPRKGTSRTSAERQTPRSTKSTSLKRGERNDEPEGLSEGLAKNAEDEQALEGRPLSKHEQESVEEVADNFDDSYAKSAGDERRPAGRPLSQHNEEGDDVREFRTKNAEDEQALEGRPLSQHEQESVEGYDGRHASSVEEVADNFDDSYAKSAGDERRPAERPLSQHNEEEEDVRELSVKNTEDECPTQEKPASKRSKEEESGQDDKPHDYIVGKESHQHEEREKRERAPKGAAGTSNQDKSEKTRNSPKEGKERRSPKETADKSNEEVTEESHRPPRKEETRSPEAVKGQSATERGQGHGEPHPRYDEEEEGGLRGEERSDAHATEDNWRSEEDEYGRIPEAMEEEGQDVHEETREDDATQDRLLSQRDEEGEEDTPPKDSGRYSGNESGRERRTVKLDITATSSDQKPPMGKGVDRTSKLGSQGSSERRRDAGRPPSGPETVSKKGKQGDQRDCSGRSRGHEESEDASRASGRKMPSPDERTADRVVSGNSRYRSPRAHVQQRSDKIDEHASTVSPAASVTSATWQPWHPAKNANSEDHIPLEKRATFRNRTETIKQLEMRSRDSRRGSGHHSSNRDSSQRGSSVGRN